MLHGPTEEDRRAAYEAAVQRQPARSPSPPAWMEDEALALAAADPRNGPLSRVLAWLAWAYNRSPLRAFLDLPDMPLLIAEGVLPPLWRRLGFLLLSPEHAAASRQAAQSLPSRSSGWLGCLVVLPVWVGLAALTLWLLLATL